MKTYILTLLVAFTVLVGACSKESGSCETKNVGDITFRNNLDDPYHCYINGAQVFTLSAYSTQTRNNVSAGAVSVKMVQASGYIFYASEYSNTVSLQPCETQTISNY